MHPREPTAVSVSDVEASFWEKGKLTEITPFCINHLDEGPTGEN